MTLLYDKCILFLNLRLFSYVFLSFMLFFNSLVLKHGRSVYSRVRLNSEQLGMELKWSEQIEI